MEDLGSCYTGSPKLLWQPSEELIKSTNVFKLQEVISKKFNITFDGYKQFHEWSVLNYSQFWEQFWIYSKIIHSHPYDLVVDTSKKVSEIPEWFHGSRLNFAENVLRRKDHTIAIYSTVEGCVEIRTRTFAQLHHKVALYAAAMKSLGVGVGDRVVGYLPNSIEAVEAMLAASSMGAVWSSTSPEFGVAGVLERFGQIKPKLIFSVNGVIYNGKTHDQLDKLKQITLGLPELIHTVVVSYLPDTALDLSSITNGISLDDFLELGVSVESPHPPLTFSQLPFNHPLFIMYSSGTTGAPKCMVHSAGGTLIKHLCEHQLHCNVKDYDIFMYFTTTGWMMWNWFVSSLASGASIVCYDGSPLIPNENVLWHLVEKLKITILGTGAKWLSLLEDRGALPGKSHDLSSLKTILSTGSPLSPQSFSYVYEAIKQDVLLGSITGGTDIIACFAGCSPVLPVHRGEIQTPMLAISLESWDEDGKRVVGQCGELVCTKAFPSMPIHFLNDPSTQRYKAAYFEKFEGVWAHGDYCQINPNTGGVWMLGRSDGTLNPGGVRFGSAEIYHIVETFSEIGDSLCVAQSRKDRMDERVVLFLIMREGHSLTPKLLKALQGTIRKQLSARHVPSIVMEMTAIPYTHSGKKVEIAIKKIVSGEKVGSRGALANPECLDLYFGLEELEGY